MAVAPDFKIDLHVMGGANVLPNRPDLFFFRVAVFRARQQAGLIRTERFYCFFLFFFLNSANVQERGRLQSFFLALRQRCESLGAAEAGGRAAGRPANK